MMRRKRIRQLAERLLDERGVKAPPVPVEPIANACGLLVRKQRLERKTANKSAQISGILFREEGDVVIGVNSSHPPVRQRFTIAHELGHFLLHEPQEIVHVDRMFEAKFRDDLSAQGVDPDEREANLFAAELLMPHHFIARDLEKAGEMDLVADDFLEELASRYEVSTQAMAFRLANLGYVSL